LQNTYGIEPRKQNLRFLEQDVPTTNQWNYFTGKELPNQAVAVATATSKICKDEL
tara:strand:+ start:258 stop:422 length:165 start_codon:yes stop_codon:yes gene_type:complete